MKLYSIRAYCYSLINYEANLLRSSSKHNLTLTISVKCFSRVKVIIFSFNPWRRTRIITPLSQNYTAGYKCLFSIGEKDGYYSILFIQYKYKLLQTLRLLLNLHRFFFSKFKVFNIPKWKWFDTFDFAIPDGFLKNLSEK